MTHALFDPALLRDVPRYTSYPTAPHFGADIGPQTYDRWLEELPDGTDVSLYLHIPFCETLCWFCACRTQGTRRREAVSAYLRLLHDEIMLVAGRMPPRARVRRVHLGGGSPSILSPAELAELFEVLRWSFDVADDAEIAAEIDPRDVTEPLLDGFAAVGLTRASLGVQDFEPLVQVAINRLQSFELTARTVEGLRSRGVRNLNIDAVYGLPHQTEDSVRRTMAAVLSLEPDRIALFGYAHVPWMSKRQQLIPEEALPGPEDRLAQQVAARELIGTRGYAAVGIDHYARPGDGLALAAAEGRLRRNFQGYTDDAAPVLLGFGASAISRLPQGYAQNAPGTADWRAAVASGRFATARGHAFSPEDRVRAAAIERLMCALDFDAAALRRAFGTAAAPLEPEARALLAGPLAPLLDGTPARFRIREHGRPLARLVAAAFDPRLAAGAARHSPAL